jgi:hypothetical protein
MWPQLPPPPPMILKSLFCTLSEGFSVNLNNAGSVVIQNTIFKDFSYWNAHKIVSIIVPPPDPQDFNKFEFTLCQEIFM